MQQLRSTAHSPNINADIHSMMILQASIFHYLFQNEHLITFPYQLLETLSLVLMLTMDNYTMDLLFLTTNHYGNAMRHARHLLTWHQREQVTR